MVTPAQRDMLRMVRRSPDLELGQIVMECATAYEGGLAWRIADRTAGALFRRGWIAEADGGTVAITEAGIQALAAEGR